MSSKNDILSAIRRHTGKRYDMPELTLDAITYEDKITQFTDSLKAAGGASCPDAAWRRYQRYHPPPFS